MKYLPLYYKWMKLGQLPNWGLCHSIGEEKICLFQPTGDKELDSWYWGFDGEFGDPMKRFDSRRTAFTPLRQTIVLFLAAMNGEL